MPQTSIPTSVTNLYAGQLAQPGAPKYARSCSAEGAGISAGKPLLRGTNPEKQVAAIGASDVVTAESFGGFALLETSRAYDASNPIDDTDGVSALMFGVIGLTASETVAAGEDVALTLSSGALVGLGADEMAASGVVRLPGCRWIESGAAGVREAFVNVPGAQHDFFVLSQSGAVSGGAGTDLAEALIGCAPEAGRLVGAYFMPAAAVTAGTTGAGTDISIEVNKRTKTTPATQVPVASGSNIAADPDAFDGDGAAAAWESIKLTEDGTAASLQCLPGDVFTYEVIAGASATYPAHKMELVFARNA